ncbi:hypothetical protein SEA_TONIANN_18 [Gordonia phage Toniann]|nr:hypothetical protein SEA_TONIANN_18 [Gordonia phage Toniann]QKY79603.1 hypothetical protein SEA_ENGINEER_18 [Gordonia Phage Engineer]WKW85824.1 hypothetical protein SEA_PHINKBODEN_19 [Gordonia Phage PhinkBoden]
MSYPIDVIDSFVEDEDGPAEGSWDEFVELIQSDRQHVRHPAPEDVEPGQWVDDAGYLRQRNEKYNYDEFVERKLGYTGQEIPGVGIATLVEDFGGEGQGDKLWFVFKITDANGGERYFRKSGWYQSYSGGEYDGPTVEVEPAEKTITVWNKKKVKK